METIPALVAAAREREGTVIDVPGRAVDYSYEEFAANSFRAANLLGHYGVHPGSTVAVAVGTKVAPSEPSDGQPVADSDGPDGSTSTGVSGVPDAAEPLLAILGSGSIGAVAEVTPDPPIDSRALVAPAWADYETTPRCSHLAYGGPPAAATVAHFEAELWSENPVKPPESVDPAAPALRADGGAHAHEDLLATAAAVVEAFGLDESSQVALSATLEEPGAIVAGVLAPLSVGATILLPGDDGDRSRQDSAFDLRVSGGRQQDVSVLERQAAGGSTLVSAAAVTASLRDTRRA